jgi:hypothetical protein
MITKIVHIEKKPLANELGITRRKSKVINLSTFGKTASVKKLESTTINLITDSEELIAIGVLIVPTIASPLSNHPTSKIRKLGYLR